MCPIRNTLLYPAKCFYLPKRQMGGPQLLHFMDETSLSLSPTPFLVLSFSRSFSFYLSLHSFFLYPYPFCVCFTWISTYNLHMFVIYVLSLLFCLFPFHCIILYLRLFFSFYSLYCLLLHCSRVLHLYSPFPFSLSHLSRFLSLLFLSFLSFLSLLFIFDFFSTLFNTASSPTPQIPLCREDAGIEPRTVTTSTLAVKQSNHWARSHPSHIFYCLSFLYIPFFVFMFV